MTEFKIVVFIEYIIMKKLFLIISLCVSANIFAQEVRLVSSSPKDGVAEVVSSPEHDEVDNAEMIYWKVESKAQFPGGLSALGKFLTDNLSYPEQAMKDSVQGRVLVEFVVEKTGEVSNVKVIRSVHPLLDAEAVRVAGIMPNWVPATIQGKPVRSKFTLPVKFVIP